jgi:hypothetical protein
MPMTARTNTIVGVAVLVFLIGGALIWISLQSPDGDERCKAAGYDHAAGLAGGDDFCVDKSGQVFERLKPH